MILCIDLKAIKTSPEVQKDLSLEDLINKHTKYYYSSEEALKDNFAPLDFCVSIRSMYSNLVVQRNLENGEKRYYTNITQIQKFPHRGYDLIMYLTSVGVLHNMNYKLGFDELMLKHSQFSPMGLCNVDPTMINPIIYTHIILSDEGMNELPQYLKEDREVVSISDIKDNTTGNMIALLDTLIEVKEENNNE